MTLNYDPNLVSSGNKALHTVKLTFAMWDYRLEVTETVGGNILGFDVLEAALDKITERVIEESSDDMFSITLSRPDGDTLEVDDSDDDAEEVLRKMLVGFEVLSVVPNGRLFEVKAGQVEG